MGARNPDYMPMSNLGYLADNGYELEARCPNCSRTARVASIPLAKRFGYYKQVEHVAGMLKCQRCGWKKIEVRRVKWSEGISTGWRPDLSP